MFKKNISGFAEKGLQNYSLFFDKPIAYRKNILIRRKTAANLSIKSQINAAELQLIYNNYFVSRTLSGFATTKTNYRWHKTGITRNLIDRSKLHFIF